MTETALTLADLVDDLHRVVEAVQAYRDEHGEPLPFEQAEAELGDGLHLHLLDYISFLELRDNLSYDRDRDVLLAGERADDALHAPPAWREAVREEFARELAEEGADDPADEPAPADEQFDFDEDLDQEDFGVDEVVDDEDDDFAIADAPDPARSPDSSAPARDSMDQTERSSETADDRYEWLDEIGSGGVGTVYQGRHLPLDRRVAIKEISDIFDVFADLDGADIVERLRGIARTQAAISHPAILQIYDLDTAATYPYVVTEFAPRGNLRRLIEPADEPADLQVVLKYFVQILHGLDTAHRQGVVHGNLKPENIVLDAAGNAKLGDFGLSTLVDLSGISSQVYVGVGDVSYMAPEQFEDPNAASVETDIYSLGIMLYEMLTGKVPGRRSPMPSSVDDQIPSGLDDIFDRMSMDERGDRYASIRAILVDFYGDDEVIDLLDRQSGVVFLHDPIAHGDSRVVDDDGEPIEMPEEPPEVQGPAAGASAAAGSEAEQEVREGGEAGEAAEAEAAEQFGETATGDPAEAAGFDDQSVSGEFDDQSVSGEFDEQPVSGEFDEQPVSGEFDDQSVSGEFDDQSVSGEFDDQSVSGEFDEQPVSGEFDDQSEAFPEESMESMEAIEEAGEFGEEVGAFGSEATVEEVADGSGQPADEAVGESAEAIIEASSEEELDRTPEEEASSEPADDSEAGELGDITSANADESEADEAELDGEDDEVLDKLDEYGDMFE